MQCQFWKVGEHQNLFMANLIVLKSEEQQRLSKLKKEDRREDLISILPNAILQHILSFLPTKDIIRTSILCKRWKNLWTSISNIDLWDSIDITKSDYLKRRASFLDSVERILLQHDDSNIERLRLSFKMPVNPTHVYSWISVAIKHNIRKLDVSLPLGCIYSLPCDLFTCESLTELRLYMACFFNPSLIHWPNLKELHLSQVTIFNRSSTQFFSSIPLLQNLVLVNCEWENIRRLSISVPNLRCLIFKQCSDPEDLLDCEIVVRVSNLVYLNCISNFSVNLLVSAC
ncbi:F-box LRR-repeat At3g58900-like isoform X1 [Olea europaea subsp. europaea]|uniref:F-box LRR-repeat At3g58900-like isoform X1 n=1 Tax=Olea europaea subsp. europaea TaxID=158383 RepID=A0A8S0UG62_OLEEU|nr:F-box LRR-repeat At3g58900-like isoform X1 [Olea europaea subsp. europaea]